MARLPRLQIEMNGHRGLFYLHPKLNYAGGDTNSVFIPIYSYGTIVAEFPSQFLVKGTNSLVLTAIDEPAQRDDSQSAGIGNSGLVYDALELDNDPAAKYAANRLTADVVPTIFYKSRDGQLVELVDVFLRAGGRLAKGEVTLTLGKEKFSQKFESDREFGEYRVELEVPEFTAPAKGELLVASHGHSSRFPVELAPGKKWNLFVVPNEHLDIGYSDYPTKVAEIQSRAIDEAIEMIGKNPDFRYSPDAYWSVEQFLHGRSPEQRQKFFDMVAQKKIFVPAQYASNVTGFASLEDTIRSLYPSYQFHLKHGGDFDYANITDVPSCTLVVCLGDGGGGTEVFRGRQRQLARPDHPVRPCQRALTLLVGRSRRRPHPDVGFPALHPGGEPFRAAAADRRRARFPSHLSPGL